MKPEDVPDELIAAFGAAEDVMTTQGESISWASVRIGLAAVLPAHEAMVRAKVAEEVYEADYAHRPLWADDEELAEGHFRDRDLAWWMTTLGHQKAHAGCCTACGCAITCTARAFADALTATAARIVRGEA